MRDFSSYILECYSMLNQINVPYAKAIKWTINNNGTKRVGLCNVEDGMYHIEINSVLLREDVPENALINTMLHEMCHTAPNCMNHGKEWQSYVNLIKFEYPKFNPNQRYSCNELGITPEEFYNNRYIYKVKCKKCGYIYASTRINKFYKNPNEYECRECGGDLERI